MDVDMAGDAQQQQQGDEQQQQQEAAAAAEEEQQDPVARWSGQVLGVLQARCGPDNKPLTTEQVLLWMEQEKVGQAQAQRAAATRVYSCNTSLSTLYGLVGLHVFDCTAALQGLVVHTHTHAGSPATWCVR